MRASEVHLSVSVSLVHQSLAVSCHISIFIALSDVEFCFITFSTLFSHFGSSFHHPPCDHCIIPFCHLLFSICTSCLPFQHVTFHFFPKLCYSNVFCDYFISYCYGLEVLASLLQKSISALNSFSLTCNQLSKFPHPNFKCVLITV
jgi:flagellar biosynthesis protein FliQ